MLFSGRLSSAPAGGSGVEGRGGGGSRVEGAAEAPCGSCQGGDPGLSQQEAAFSH